MNNQENKQTDMANLLDNIFRKIQDLNSQLQMIESQNTKARDVPRGYKCHQGYRTYTRYDYENSHTYDWCATKKEQITSLGQKI